MLGMAHKEPTVCILAALKDATYVHVRCDRHHGPFDPAYDVPYGMVEHHDKTVVINIPGHGHNTVTLDRIKPSVIDASDPLAPPRARPRGRPPLHHRSPSLANMARAPEVCLQEVPRPSRTACFGTANSCATSSDCA